MPTPEPGVGEVQIDVEACAVCRTDLQIVTGDLPSHRSPIIPGHQVVGRISAIGGGVDQTRLGERVGVAWLASSCGACRWCRSGRENLCDGALFTGWDVDGGYSDAMIARSTDTYRLPDDADAAAWSPLLCGGVIGLRSLRIAQVQPGMRVGLYGFGASATLVLQVLNHWGCDSYVVTRSDAEIDRARSLGATWAGTYDTAPPVALDAAITFAPAGWVVPTALRHLSKGGVVAVNAIHLDGGVPGFDYADLWWERSIRSVANVTRADITDFLDLVPRAGIRTQIEELPLADANTALDRLGRGDVAGAFVLRP